MAITMTDVLKRQLKPVFVMLEELTEGGGEEFWLDGKTLYWKHLLHAATGVAFWLRGEGEGFAPESFGKDVADFDRECADWPTREELAGYIREMREKAAGFLDSLDEAALLEPNAVYKEFTNADALLGQLRHIQHHIGACNRIRAEAGVPAVQWRGYRE